MRRAENDFKNVALVGRQLTIIGEHRSRGFVPGYDIPERRFDNSWAIFKSVEYPLQAGRNPVGYSVFYLWGMTQRQHVKMPALRLREKQTLGYTVERIG